MPKTDKFLQSMTNIPFLTAGVTALIWVSWFIPKFKYPVDLDGAMLFSYFKIGGRTSMWYSLEIIPIILVLFTFLGFMIKRWKDKKAFVLIGYISLISASFFSFFTRTTFIFPWRQASLWVGNPFDKHCLYDFFVTIFLTIGFLMFSLSLRQETGTWKLLYKLLQILFYSFLLIILRIILRIEILDIPINIFIPLLLILTLITIGKGFQKN